MAAVTPDQKPVRCTLQRAPITECGKVMYRLDFNVVLHEGASDFWVYKNDWDGHKGYRACETHPFDSDLLTHLIAELMADGTGVYSLTVQKYSLEVWVSTAVDEQDIRDIVDATGRFLGLC